MTEKKTNRSLSFGSQRMSVAVLVLLMFVTCGVIAPAWFLMRRELLDSLRASEKIGPTLPVLNLLISLGAIVFSGLVEAGTIARPSSFLMSMVNIVVVIPYWMLAFRTRRMLQQHVARGRGFYTRLSWVGTFFLGILYLQYKINQIADAPQESRESDEPNVA